MKPSQLISINLRQINSLYKKLLAKELSEHDLDQYVEVLWTLAGQERPVTQNKLAELLQVDKSRVVHVVFDLEKRKLVQVTLNPSDRREHYVTLSESARRSLLFIEQSIEKINDVAREGIPEDKLDTFFEVSEQMQQNLRRSV